ncbi:MAG: hypothetical protein DMG58_11865 [Acidobacteria bacterium]|nr:MAG: hypothetical protein DMG58_11865 [Acidobacteriota bacterium]
MLDGPASDDSAMKRLLLLLLLVPLAAPENAGKAKRLEWVAWNPVEHILYWEVSEGRYDVHGQYEPERRLDRYSLDPIRSTMQHAGDARGFMPEEGDRLHAQLDALAHYTMSSTLWWDGDNGKPAVVPPQVVSGAPDFGAGKVSCPRPTGATGRQN